MDWNPLLGRLMVVSYLACFASTACYSQEKPGSDRKLVVATKEAAPFAIKGGDGRWTGISIDLWRDIANDLTLSYEFREMELDKMFTSLQDGSCDVAIAAITITNDRERVIDFTHPFYTSGLGIAVAPDEPSGSLHTVWKAMASKEFLEILFGLLLVLLTVGLITIAGRLLAIVWMFTSLFMISFFTASVASLVLVDRLESRVSGLSDLPNVQVATVRDSTSEAFLRRQRGIRFRTYDTPQLALEALDGRVVDAVVYDAPILRHAINKKFRGTLAVLPVQFESQNYGIGLPAGSKLREPLNQSLLRITSEPDWKNILYRYLGQ